MNVAEFGTIAGRLYLMGYPEKQARRLAGKIEEQSRISCISVENILHVARPWLGRETQKSASEHPHANAESPEALEEEA